jgi:hypothetical protein
MKTITLKKTLTGLFFSLAILAGNSNIFGQAASSVALGINWVTTGFGTSIQGGVFHNNGAKIIVGGGTFDGTYPTGGNININAGTGYSNGKINLNGTTVLTGTLNVYGSITGSSSLNAASLTTTGAITSTGGGLNSMFDITIGTGDGRNQGTLTRNRAIVHGFSSDELYLNFGGDFEGGVYVQGTKLVANAIGIGVEPGIYALNVGGDIHANTISAEGNSSFYFPTYGGGFYMSDNVWIRTKNNKNIWTDAGLLGSQGGLTLGYGGAAPVAGGAIIAGNVSIGSTSPRSKLDIWGGDLSVTGTDFNGTAIVTSKAGIAYFGNNAYNNGLKIDANGYATLQGGALVNGFFTTQGDIKIGLGDGRSQGSKLLNRAIVHGGWDNVDELIINYDGDFEGGVFVHGPKLVANKIGVGTGATNNYALNVAGDGGFTGTVYATQVIVQATIPMADYVFKPNYKLPTLAETEAFIKENGHLEGVPTEAEVMEKGMNMGDMNVILLKKIEEITLIMIEQNKTIEALKAKVENFENK